MKVEELEQNLNRIERIFSRNKAYYYNQLEQNLNRIER